jgi:hypothetical protein
MAAYNRLGGNRLIKRSAAPAPRLSVANAWGRGRRVLGRPEVLPFIGTRAVFGIEMPFAVRLVRMDIPHEVEVPFNKHLEVLAPAKFQAAAARLYAVPHFVGERYTLRACCLAHAQLLRIVESVLTHFM